MAGHSKFKNIQHRKGAQDKKRAKVFTRLIKELAVAARAGTDPDANPRLRTALAGCRAANMPKDNVERVLKRAEGGEGELYEEIRYEGYGTGGTAFIVEALTDNRNRTASEVRAAFNKFGGTLGETGSVSFMFDKVGQMIFDVDVDEGHVQTLLKFMDTLDDNEDVQNIAFNFEISDEIMAKLEG